MALFHRDIEHQIGRGEVAETRLEAPFFAVLMIFGALTILIAHFYFDNVSLTVALTVSMLVFGMTVLRVELGLAVLVFAMLLSPEITVGQVGASTMRTLNIRYDDILIIVIFLGVLLKQAWEGKGSLWRRSPINSGIFAYYFVCIVSTLLAYRRGLPFWDSRTAFFVMLKMLEFYLIFVLVGSAIETRRQIRRSLALLFFVACIIAVFANYSIGAIDRVSAPFEKGGTEPNTLGGYLTLMMCVAAGLFIHAPSRKLKLLHLGLFLLMFIPFLYTLSRASYVALIVGILAMGVMARKAVLVAGTVLVLVLAPMFMPEVVVKRVSQTFEPSGEEVSIGSIETGIQVDKSTHERLYVWQKVKYNMRVWPLFGGGIEWDTVMDSQYARVIIETGLIGLCAFLFMQLRILQTTRQAAAWSPDWLGQGLALGVFAATLALMAHSLGTISFLIVRVMEPFWYLVALVVVVRDQAIADYVAKKAELDANAGDVPETAPTRSPAAVSTRAKAEA